MLHVRGLIHCCSSHVRRSWNSVLQRAAGPYKMARVGLADHGQKCPFMGVKRSRRLRAGNGVIDPSETSSLRPSCDAAFGLASRVIELARAAPLRRSRNATCREGLAARGQGPGFVIQTPGNLPHRSPFPRGASGGLSDHIVQPGVHPQDDATNDGQPLPVLGVNRDLCGRAGSR